MFWAYDFSSEKRQITGKLNLLGSKQFYDKCCPQMVCERWRKIIQHFETVSVQVEDGKAILLNQI